MRYVVAAILLFTLTVAAQDATRLEFDVSSVKPVQPTPRSLAEITATLVRRPPPGQWRLLGLTLKNVIIIAYPEFRLPGLIVGDPTWVKETRFDLQPRMSPTATHTEVQAMLRHLLEDRFALRTHVDQRLLDVYLLTLKTPGKLGPGLTRAATACIVWRLTGGRVPDECDAYRRHGGEGAFTTSVATIPDLITVMSMTGAIGAPSLAGVTSAIDRPVVDRTGLEGYFQIVGPSPIGAQPNGSFFTLMEEQLGLRLTRAREMVDVLVIDSVTMPDPD